jgi:hypothetical protein
MKDKQNNLHKVDDALDETQRYQLCHYNIVVAQLVALGFIKSV